jgi:hypothetical protein
MAILRNAAAREGYSLEISKDPIEIELFIKSDWISFDGIVETMYTFPSIHLII